LMITQLIVVPDETTSASVIAAVKPLSCNRVHKNMHS